MTALRSESQADATHVVELTPVGRGAVAVVLVVGPRALAAVEQCFLAHSRRPLRDVPLNRMVVGRWKCAAGEELVVARRSEDRVEVHCHGGVAAVRAAISDLIAQGCLEVTWREWVRLGAIPSCCESPCSFGDTTLRAAYIALADVTTARTAAILVDQLNGALARAIATAIDGLQRCDWQQASSVVCELLSCSQLGRHLTTPWRVVLAGPPNVGKSSLINALTGFHRAIVSPVPGTTRDVVTLTTAIEGWPVELTDTAGLRATKDELEAIGVQLTQEMLATADLVLLIHDATCETFEPPPDEAFFAPPGAAVARQPVIHVWNKMDLVFPPRRDEPAAKIYSAVANHPVVFTSAVTGQGLAELTQAIGAALVPNPPAMGEGVPFTESQVEALVVARNAVERRHAAAALEALHLVLASA